MATQHGLWVSYSGTAEIVLAAALLATAVAVAFAGLRLPLPARLPRPGRAAKACLVTAWLVAIAALLVSDSLYVLHAQREHLVDGHALPADPITPVTVIGVGIIWFAVTLMHNARGWRIALGSGVIAALAAPWIFELPFDLIIMTRVSMPPDSGAYRILFFGLLLGIAITTLALLTRSPVVRLTRAAFWCFAGMLAVFAVWALVGFAYPSAPVPFALNVVSKILAFLTALSLFLPERSQAGAPELEQAPEVWTSVL
jgi:hypothetical protein